MESDLSLIKKIQESRDGNSLSELINRHSGIYVYIVDQYTRNDKMNINKRSMIEDKDYIIYKSALEYDPDRNSKFSTFLANQTKWKCLNEINRKEKMNVPFESYSMGMIEHEDSSQKLSKIEAFDIFNKMLTEESDKRVKKIIDIRYNTSNNKLVPWKNAAKKLNLSIQGCINIHDRFIEKVKNKLDQNYV